MSTSPTETPTETSPLASLGCSLLLALPFLGAGFYVMGISFGFLPSDPASFKAPPLIVGGAGIVFACGGLMILLRGSFSPGAQQSGLYHWLNFAVNLVLLVAFAGVFLWVGFGPGERAFQTSTSVGPVTTYGEGSSLTGRCIFGTFGAGVLLAALFYAYKQIMTLPSGVTHASE